MKDIQGATMEELLIQRQVLSDKVGAEDSDLIRQSARARATNSEIAEIDKEIHRRESELETSLS